MRDFFPYMTAGNTVEYLLSKLAASQPGDMGCSVASSGLVPAFIYGDKDCALWNGFSLALNGIK